MFISDLAIAESDHDHKRHLDPLPSRWNTWQYPVPLSRVREFEDQLVHQLVVADGARDESGFYIRGVLRDEPFGIELPHSVSTHASSHDRDGNIIRVSDHR